MYCGATVFCCSVLCVVVSLLCFAIHDMMLLCYCPVVVVCPGVATMCCVCLFLLRDLY